MSAEPYSPSSETRLFPNPTPGAPPARLETRQPLLGNAPPAQLHRQASTSSTRGAPPAYDNPNNVASLRDIKDTQPQGEQAQKIAAIREGLRETQDAMHKNIEAIQERGERMEHLQNRTDQLVIQSQTFKSTARSAHRAMWWKNMKWKIIICVALLFIVGGTIGGAVRGSEYANSH